MGEVFQVKPIKPENLKVDAVRLEMLNALRKEGRASRKLLAGTVKYWAVKPKFDLQISVTRQDVSLLVGPVGDGAREWQWVNDGTPAHDIYPVRAKFLRFQPGSTGGSTPNTLKVSPVVKYGPFVYTQYVRHPGIKARNWTIVVLDERYIPFRTGMNTALAKGLQKGGWD